MNAATTKERIPSGRVMTAGNSTVAMIEPDHFLLIEIVVVGKKSAEDFIGHGKVHADDFPIGIDLDDIAHTAFFGGPWPKTPCPKKNLNRTLDTRSIFSGFIHRTPFTPS